MRWFLAGLGVGTVVGMVVAPKSGEETREELMEGAQEQLRQVRNAVEPYVEGARRKVEPALQRVQERIEPVVEEGREKLDAASQQVSRAVENVSSGGLLAILNEWPHEKLIKIPGIGPILATKIIQNRPYKSEDDLINSKELPPSAIANLRKSA
jgi:DNA uptake protein ComE-like DNA-binding protein